MMQLYNTPFFLLYSKNKFRIFLYAQRPVKKLRLEAGYTQKEMAEKLDIVYQNYQRYENGKVLPRPDMIQKLASLFNVSSDYIQGRDDGLEQIINIINENSPTDEDKQALAHLISSYFKNKK